MIKATSIFKDFKSQKNVLRDINFHAKNCEIISIIGKNGSGKTTLLKILSTLLLPSKGKIIIAGSSNYKKIKKEVGFLSADPQGLFGRLTGYENLLYINSFHKKNVDDKINSWRELPTFATALRTPFSQCSSGMKFSLLLFKALAHNPQVLLLDEPFSNLDQAGVDFATQQINQFAKKGTVILTTHQHQYLDRLDTKIMQLQEGHLA